MKNIATIILAAGEGTRMKSSLPKVLHNICGKPMLEYLIDNVNSIGMNKVFVIVGHKAGLVKKQISGIKCITQSELLGTGDAVTRARSALLKDNKISNILILYGDTPLLSQETIKKLIEKHVSASAGATLLTAQLKNPTGYGRVIRSPGNKIVKIVEELDASIYEKVVEEINVGVYCFNKRALFYGLEKIKPNNKKEEYYLTDTIEVLTKANISVESVSTNDPEEFLGVNTRAELGKAESVMKKRILNKIMDAGVTVIDPNNTYIEQGAGIGKDTVIYPYTFIENDVKIGSNCSIGPFARLRPGTIVGDNVGIGNFVEIVRSSIGRETKIRHQCYIGDTIIGKNVNIGAGTIVANYDGKEKHKTIIEDNAFIGTGTILIAPVKVGRGAITGAGSVVTRNKNVPAGKTVVGIPARVVDKNRKK
ncbi:MAG: bifunctional UDP-N-acetylglucosamine diphosphorylase/glucosamine-1-phosphate N-acetyltransferase GlmU [Candidatus Omnitrophica bacterium CG22_combo_CG10-13_8_21_14_all_43_16]|nr:MAG: bifunctional UDP-N-acetylglucosamine diphosphorylase/glucosamine-1-phosphate N-acetyltransferase GlmU [Candidatus Omnitrophica bacterium CG22_combo_CG10-13_8_21_14_all_43_16]